MRNIDKKRINIHNKPTIISLILAFVGITLSSFILYSLLATPMYKTNAGFFLGLAFISDLLKILYLYLAVAALVILAFYIVLLAIRSIKTDYPFFAKTAVLLGGLSIIICSFSLFFITINAISILFS